MIKIKETILNLIFALPMWVLLSLVLLLFGFASIFFITLGIFVGIPLILYDFFVKDN